MKKIIASLVLFGLFSVVFANNDILNYEAKSWASGSKCQLKKKNIEICKIVDSTIKLSDNMEKLLGIKNKYDTKDSIKFDMNNPDDFLKKAKVSESDSKNIKLYRDRIKNNYKNLCESHNKLNADEREFLEGLKLRYNDTKIYDEAEFNEVCEQ